MSLSAGYAGTIVVLEHAADAGVAQQTEFLVEFSVVFEHNLEQLLGC